MKRISIKLVALSVLLTAGMAGLNAQNFRGNQYLRNQRGACVTSSGLTTAQQAEIQKLSDSHQKEMDALRTELRSTSNLAQRKTIRDKMDQIQTDQRTKIIELGATPPNTPHSGFLGLGRGAGGGLGLGASGAAGGGRGLGLGAGRAAGGGRGLGLGARRGGRGGRGLGPCGGGLGPRR